MAAMLRTLLVQRAAPHTAPLLCLAAASRQLLARRFSAAVGENEAKGPAVTVARPRFVDKAYIHVKGGTGGMGGAGYGGTGGNGGSVVIEARPGSTLPGPERGKRFYAEPGGSSSRTRGRRGKTAQDVVLYVPMGTCVYDAGDGQRIADLDTAGQRVVVAEGGKGGSQFTEGYNPLRGEARRLRLELKSIADVGLVGFPNAGKSTLLTAISNARPKVADYPFTTLRPHLGNVEFADHSKLTVADIPGLIEGAHANMGMGHKFLRHIERTKALLYVIDSNGFRLSEKEELRHYDASLLERPSIIVLNKADLPGAEDAALAFCERLEHERQDATGSGQPPQPPVTATAITSAATGLGIQRVKELLYGLGLARARDNP